MALATPSFFYAALMLGRSLAPFLLRNGKEIALVRAGLLIASAGTASLLFANGLPGVLASACLAGLGLSFVYPITISLLSKEFGAASSRIGSVMFVLSNIGGGLLPWIVGISSNRFATLKAGLAVPLSRMFGDACFLLERLESIAGLAANQPCGQSRKPNNSIQRKQCSWKMDRIPLSRPRSERQSAQKSHLIRTPFAQSHHQTKISQGLDVKGAVAIHAKHHFASDTRGLPVGRQCIFSPGRNGDRKKQICQD